MTPKKTLSLVGLGLTVLVAALGLPPQELSAGCEGCLPAGETATHEGGGFSCAEADQNAIDAAMAEVPPGTWCATEPIEVVECHPIYVDRPIYFAEWKVRYSRSENLCL